MTDTATKPVYLVDADSDPVVVKVNGRACFQNSACLREFATEVLHRGKTRFVLDFQNCASMDSTFLGVLAGLALDLKKVPGSSLILARMGARNLELVRNLGLHRLLKVDSGESVPSADNCTTALNCASDRTELEHARLVLEAHENLVSIDESNRAKFQDVLAFLKNRVGQK